MSSPKGYQVMQMQVQLKKITKHIEGLYINGKNINPGETTLPEWLHYFKSQGFQVIEVEKDTENIRTYFYTLEREFHSDNPPKTYCLEHIARINQGIDLNKLVISVFEHI